MAVKCASCKGRVEDGAVRCMNCGASLSSPASFFQVIGWVLVAVSSIPVGLGVVLEGEHNHVPLVIGAVVFVLGLVLVFVASAVGRGLEESPVTSDEPSAMSE